MSGYRPAYTLDEDKKILRFIIDNKGFVSLRGRAFWVDMESAKVIDRTWQSCKEHFLKQIYPKLSNPVFGLTAEEVEQIRDGFESTSYALNARPDKPRRARTDFNIEDIIDSSDED